MPETSAAPGNNQLSGDHKSRDSILAMYGQLAELTNGTLRVDDAFWS